jgi:hypothetical protein
MQSLDVALLFAAVAACVPESARDSAAASLILVLAGTGIVLTTHIHVTGAPWSDWHGTVLWLVHVAWQACVCFGILPMPILGTRLQLVHQCIYLAVLARLHFVGQVRCMIYLMFSALKSHDLHQWLASKPCLSNCFEVMATCTAELM